MLTKADVLRNLAASPLDPDRCWITAGGALLFHGLRRETGDIDMGCEPSVADELEAAGYIAEQSPEGRRRFHLSGNIDVSEDWARGCDTRMDGVRVVSLQDVLILKRQLGRPKDQADIAAIEEALKEN